MPRHFNRKYNKYSVSSKEKRTEDGIVFASLLECRVYKFLRDTIGTKNFELQPKFELLPKFRDKDGKAIRAIHYVADFLVKDGKEEHVVDAKGAPTETFKIKAKLFKYRYKKRLYLLKNNKEMVEFASKLKHIKFKKPPELWLQRKR